jgi:hypothetical protein
VTVVLQAMGSMKKTEEWKAKAVSIEKQEQLLASEQYESALSIQLAWRQTQVRQQRHIACAVQ